MDTTNNQPLEVVYDSVSDSRTIPQNIWRSNTYNLSIKINWSTIWVRMRVNSQMQHKQSKQRSKWLRDNEQVPSVALRRTIGQNKHHLKQNHRGSHGPKYQWLPGWWKPITLLQLQLSVFHDLVIYYVLWWANFVVNIHLDEIPA